MLASAIKKQEAVTAIRHATRLPPVCVFRLGEDKRLVSNDLYFRDLNDCVVRTKTSQAGAHNNSLLSAKLVDENVRVY